MSLAAATMIFASCSKDEEGINIGVKETQLSIKLAGVITTKAVEEPGVTGEGTIKLNNGYIFVLDPSGSVVHKEALDVDAAQAGGQRLANKVPLTSSVYIIGNMPDGFNASGLSSLSAIRAAESEITTQRDYKMAALANHDGQPQSVQIEYDGTATATVTIKPLISRIELGKIKGKSNILSFKVTGVYVDSYKPYFTYGGTGGEEQFEQNQSIFYNGINFYKDEGEWTADGTPMVAMPADGTVWAYNVAAGGLPRLIIRLTGITYEKSGQTVDMSNNTYFLTITGYQGMSTSAFERGKIYRIGGSANGEDNGITFDDEDLSDTPNQKDVNLTVRVKISEWEMAYPTAIL